MKNIYGQHTFYFALITIFLSGIMLIIGESLVFFNQSVTSIICFFLILTVGISHGALDNYKADKILKFYKVNNRSVFYFSYIFISGLVILSWIFFSLFTLLIFLLIASYHFGKEDTSFLIRKNSNLDQLLFFVKGSMIIFAPLFFHTDETLGIFEILFVKDSIFLNFIKNEHWLINICLGLNFLSYFYFVFRNKFDNFEILFLDLLLILILNFVFSPLLAFTAYFCFLHSIRHIISIVLELDEANFLNGIKLFVKKALPLTILTAILYLMAVFFLSNFYSFNNAIIQVIFIGLASLTFPHILLEYLVEKNETKN